MLPSAKGPRKEALGVLGMLLRVASPVHVEHKTRSAISSTVMMSKRKPEMSLPDPCRSVYHRQRPWQKSPAKHLIKLRQA
jgi:hypothetical protein